MPGDDKEVYADGYIKVPKRRWWQIADVLTRQDELMDAILKVLGAINEKLAAWAPPAPPALPPAPAPPAPPAPPEWIPLTSRLDIIASRLDMITSRFRGLPIARVGRYTGAATTWQTLVAWYAGIVWSRRSGSLEEISMVSNNYASTRFRFRIELGEPLEDKIVLFDELQIQSPLTLPFPENHLPYGTWVYLDCRTTGAPITVDGSITGREWSY